MKLVLLLVVLIAMLDFVKVFFFSFSQVDNVNLFASIILSARNGDHPVLRVVETRKCTSQKRSGQKSQRSEAAMN